MRGTRCLSYYFMQLIMREKEEKKCVLTMAMRVPNQLIPCKTNRTLIGICCTDQVGIPSEL